MAEGNAEPCPTYVSSSRGCLAPPPSTLNVKTLLNIQPAAFITGHRGLQHCRAENLIAEKNGKNEAPLECC